MTASSLAKEYARLLAERDRKAAAPLSPKRRRNHWLWRRPIVLFGAGNVGRDVANALRKVGVSVVSFADNNPERWGTSWCEIPVGSVPAIGRHYGSEAVFVVTIGNLVPAARSAVTTQLRAVGMRRVRFLEEVVRLLPDLQASYFLDPAYYQSSHVDAIVSAYELLADSVSRRQFRSQLRWRLLLDEDGAVEASPRDQYFPRGLQELWPIESFVDVGAYDGDTLRALFACRGDSFGTYMGFEPDPANFARLETYVSKLSVGLRRKLVLFQYAVTDTAGPVRFSASGTVDARRDEAAETVVPGVRLDEVVGERPVSIVKIDVEGGEREVLASAGGVLDQERPVLAVAAYHHPSDLFDLPLALLKMAPDYRLYLRSHGRLGLESVLYAVPAEARSLHPRRSSCRESAS